METEPSGGNDGGEAPAPDPRAARNPLAALHPRALRACAALRHVRHYFILTAVAGLCLMVVVPALGAIVFAAGFSAVWILTAARWAVILFFFARCSLRQMFFTTLGLNTFVTLVVLLPGGWKIPAGMGLGTVVMWVVVYIWQQDPEGEAATPPFISQALRDRKLRAIRKKREAGKVQAEDHSPQTTREEQP